MIQSSVFAVKSTTFASIGAYLCSICTVPMEGFKNPVAHSCTMFGELQLSLQTYKVSHQTSLPALRMIAKVPENLHISPKIHPCLENSISLYHFHPLGPHSFETTENLIWAMKPDIAPHYSSIINLLINSHAKRKTTI